MAPRLRLYRTDLPLVLLDSAQLSLMMIINKDVLHKYELR